MAGKPIELVLNSDVSGVEKGMDRVADGFDNVTDALDDVSDGAKDTGKALERSLDDVSDSAKDTGKDLDKALDLKSEAKKTESALEGIEDGLEEVADKGKEIDRDLTTALESVAAEAKTTGKAVGDSMSDGAREASEGMEQMSGDAASNATEVAASFDGSAESIVDGMQGALAEMFSGFGPAGAAAGLAVALGLGAAMTAAQDAADAVNEAGEEISDLGSEIYDMGGDIDDVDFTGKMLEWGRSIQDTRQFWELWQDKAKSGFQVIKEESEAAGTSWKEAFLAANGPMKDSQKFLADTADEHKKLTAEIEAYGKASPEYQKAHLNEAAAINEVLEPLKNQRKAAEDNIEKQKDAIEISEMSTEIAGKSADAIEAETEATEAATEAIEAKADAQREATGANVDAMTAQMDYSDVLKSSTDDIAANGQATDLLSEAGKANNRTLIDLAGAGAAQLGALEAQGAATDVLTAKTNSTRDAFVAQAIAAGYNKTEAEALAISLGLIPPEVTTAISQTGGAETKAIVESIPGEKDVAVAVTDGGTKDDTQAGVDSLEGKDIPVTVIDKGTTAAAQKGINALKGKDVAINVNTGRTVSNSQSQINGLKGKTVDVSINLSNLGYIQEQLRLLTLPRSIDVVVNERPGRKVN